MPRPRFVCVRDFEEYAESILDRNSRVFIQAGSYDDHTLRENVTAFKRLRLRPRVLRDVSSVEMSTTVQGHAIDFPVMVAPSSMHRVPHPDGETATARASQELGTGYVMSCASTSSFTEVVSASPSGLKWFQLYVHKDRAVTLSLVRGAERHGFQALVLTVDAPVGGRSTADQRQPFLLPTHLRLSLYEETGADSKDAAMSGELSQKSMPEFTRDFFDASLTWADVRWLKKNTKLPLIVKGILTAEDAHLAVENGVDGIMVSNHGGRRLDSVPATIEALPEVIVAVDGRCEVYVDGGIRSGIDVIKCLALGARAVLVGRPVLWGLAFDGQNGVCQVLQILRDELRIAMALSGARTVAEISRDMVVHESYYTNPHQTLASRL